eukprot:213417-Ditylum_brightwellii.AAC.1
MAAGCWGGKCAGAAGGLAAYGLGAGVGCCRSGTVLCVGSWLALDGDGGDSTCWMVGLELVGSVLGYSSATFVDFQRPARFKFVMEILASANEVAPDLHAK